MKKLVDKSDDCIVKYKDCWAGDVRTALCLRDLGILITPSKNFNKDPPNHEFWFPKDPCERPITFHHMLLNQMQRLHKVSKIAAGNGSVADYSSAPNYGDVFNEFSTDFNYRKIELDTNRKGNDYKDVAAEEYLDCMEICSKDYDCASWSFDNKRCWLKKSVSSSIEAKGVVSGVILGRYVCRK